MSPSNDEQIDRFNSTPEYDDVEVDAQSVPDPVPDVADDDEEYEEVEVVEVEVDEDELEDGDEDEEYEYEYVEEVVEEEVEVDEEDEAAEPAPAPQPRAERPASPAELAAVAADQPDARDQDSATSTDLLSAAVTSNRTTARRTPVRRRTTANDGIKSTVAPIIFTVGILVLFPALWAWPGLDSVMGSDLDIQHDEESTKQMKQIMLVCWLIAPILIGTGITLFYQVTRNRMAAAAEARQKAKEEKEAQEKAQAEAETQAEAASETA